MHAMGLLSSVESRLSAVARDLSWLGRQLSALDLTLAGFRDRLRTTGSALAAIDRRLTPPESRPGNPPAAPNVLASRSVPMNGIPELSGQGPSPCASKRWIAHSGHEGARRPHQRGPRPDRSGRPGTAEALTMAADGMVTLDGSEGEGGGQILRTALSLSMITGRPFRIRQIRANRDKPGLRPQHLAAVEASALLCGAEVEGGSVGSRDLTFRPGEVRPRDLEFAIGTAGATALVVQALHLPIALKADRAVQLAISGGTFNDKAPSFPFLERCWREHMKAIGLPVTLAMPAAGFYPRGGGLLEAWVDPGTPRPITRVDRGDLVRVSGVAGVANLRHHDIAGRLRARAIAGLAARGIEADIGLADWPGPGHGAAISLTAEYGLGSATFVALGERGKPSEAVADEAVAELLAFHDGDSAVDPHSADQLLLPLALAEGVSRFTTPVATEHLRTNARTIGAFLDREIAISEGPDGPVIVTVHGAGITKSS